MDIQKPGFGLREIRNSCMSMISHRGFPEFKSSWFTPKASVGISVEEITKKQNLIIFFQISTALDLTTTISTDIIFIHIQRKSLDEIWEDGPRDLGIKSSLPDREYGIDTKRWHTLFLELFLHTLNPASFLGCTLQLSNSLVTTEWSSRQNTGLGFGRPEL